MSRLARFLTIALLATFACARSLPDDQAVAIVRRYDELLIQAFRSGNAELMEPVAGEQEMKKMTGLVGVKLDMGYNLDAALLDFRVEGVRREKDAVLVSTAERWHYLDRKIGTGQQIGQDSTDSYEMRYVLRRRRGGWVVDEVQFASTPVVGRSQVIDRADANVFHGMTVQPKGARPPGRGAAGGNAEERSP